MLRYPYIFTNSSFHTSVHIKPNNHQPYLHSSSCHSPQHFLKLCTVGASVTIPATCSISPRLSPPVVITLYPSLMTDSLYSSTHPAKNQLLITTYHLGLHILKHILKEIHDILLSTLGSRPPSITFCHSPNLC